MNKLWAPWRRKYVQAKSRKGCIFCDAAKAKVNAQVIFRTKYSLVMLNIFPYNNGHLMVAPRRHTNDLSKLSECEALDIFKALTTSQKLLRTVLKPAGFNVGINISRVAGAGIPGHLHIHIVPRWVGDTNFMPVMHNTKVISQSLDELARLLRKAYAKEC